MWRSELARVTLLVGICATGSATAFAQSSSEARQHFERAQQFFDAGDYESAIAGFQRSYELIGNDPFRFSILYNIGYCQEQLFQYDRAFETYSQFIRGSGAGHDRYRDAQQRLRELERRMGYLEITANASEAAVWVDDRDLHATAPGRVRVAAGQHIVELRARGFAPGRQDVHVAARAVVPVSFTLDRSFAGLHPALGLSVAGVAVASAGVAAAFGAIALDERGRIDTRLASGEPRERYQVTQASIASMEQNALIADVLFGVAGGLAIASAVMLIFTDWEGGSSETARRPTLTPYASTTGGGLSFGGTL